MSTGILKRSCVADGIYSDAFKRRVSSHRDHLSVFYKCFLNSSERSNISLMALQIHL